MRQPVYSGQFQRDVKRSRKRGKDMEKLKAVMRCLISGGPLAPRYKDHSLGGEWACHRECHIEPDWLLIYRLCGENSEIRFERTGTHADLFR
jgi:mRNA interferase YafQ